MAQDSEPSVVTIEHLNYNKAQSVIVLPTSAVSPPHIGANEKARSAELLGRGETASGSTPTGLRRTRIVGPRIANSPFVRQDLIWAESGSGSGGGGGSSSLHKHLLLHRNPHLGHQGSAPPSGLSRVTSERAINHHRINPRETVSIVASTNNNAGGSTTVSTVTTTVSRSLFTNGNGSDRSGDGQSGDGEHTVVTTVLTQQRRHSVSVTWDQQSLLEAQAQKVRTQQALRGKGDQWEEGDEGEDDDGWEEMRLHEKQPIRRKEKSDVNKEKEAERIEVIIPDVKPAEEDDKEKVKKEEQEKEKEREQEKEREKEKEAEQAKDKEKEKEKEKEREEEKEEKGSGKEDAGKEVEAGKEKSSRRKRKTSSKGHGDSLRDSKGKEKTKLKEKEKEKEKEREKNMEKSKITDEEKEESRPLSHSKTDAASRRKDLAGTDTSDRSVKVYRFLRIYLFFLVLC